MEILIASNFYIWRSTILRCGCTARIPMVIETTVVPDAMALGVELQMGSYLSYVINQFVTFLNTSTQASTVILKTGHKLDGIATSVFEL
ncbi:hypothetical protein I79_000422 [Cricetulus griseus]|uniref:Uncharacterized protein n=1 Tax=Cricetulus griseus TaxID=10029 RepID=G3GSA4_CRIGR|nr:hypothetical protein I79_000422 [Cricetulus griseus]